MNIIRYGTRFFTEPNHRTMIITNITAGYGLEVGYGPLSYVLLAIVIERPQNIARNDHQKLLRL